MNQHETLRAAREYYGRTLQWLDSIHQPTGEIAPQLLQHRCCPLCAAEQPRRYAVKLGFEYVRCGRCHMVYVPDVLDDVHEGDLCDDYVSLMRHTEADAAHFRRILGLCRGRSNGHRLLDVGCGNGRFMAAAQQLGWTTVGVEMNPKLAARARQIAPEVHAEPVEQLELPPDSFDAVALLQVVEHLRDPVQVLRHAHRLLRDDGVLVLDTPNVAAHIVRLLGPERHRHFCGWMHLNLFSPATLRALVRRAGFRPVFMTTYADELGLQTLRALRKYPEIYDPVSPQYLASAEAGTIPWERPLPRRDGALWRGIRAAVRCVDAALAGPANLLRGGAYLLLLAVKETH